MTGLSVKENVKKILSELPPGVTLQAACKKRTAQEIQQAVNAGVTLLGENYVNEAFSFADKIKGDVRWHMIGHLQKNKVTRALDTFHLIETLDSNKLAEKLNKSCERTSKKIDCLIEVNSGRELNKSGVLPENVKSFIKQVASYENISIRGLMTMGPLVNQPEEIRPYFRITRELFEDIASMGIPGVNMDILSMGMSSSYHIAVEEGATIVRLGTAIFGPRE